LTTSETVSAYAVEGMTCAHCAAAVTDELSKLPLVRQVHVELVAGGVSAVRVSSAGALDLAAVAEAVDEAGYVLVGHDAEPAP